MALFHPRPVHGGADDEVRRHRMVERQIAGRGVRDPRVLAAMGRVPRHRFVPAEAVADAYEDFPLPIGHGQTISQPYIVAYMIEALDLPDGARVLEVGAGSGYQAAVLAEAGFEVFTIEIVPELAEAAAGVLRELGYSGVALRCGDGSHGWPEEAPFAGIVVAAAAAAVPDTLLGQLAHGGHLVMPVGTDNQELTRIVRTADGWERESLLPVRFVPLTQPRE